MKIIWNIKQLGIIAASVLVGVVVISWFDTMRGSMHPLNEQGATTEKVLSGGKEISGVNDDALNVNASAVGPQDLPVTSDGTDAVISQEASRLLPTPYKLLAPDIVDPNIAIGGKSYSLDLLNVTLQNTKLATAANELLRALPLPKPVLVVGLPKAGTSSIHSFFLDSGHSSVHWKNGVPNTPWRVGTCMKQAADAGKPLIAWCGNYSVYAQMDVTDPQLPDTGCHYPQITFLLELHQEAPNATFILNRRNFTDWASSVYRWDVKGRDQLGERWVACKPFGPSSTSREELIQWHKDQIQRVRQFVLDHPTHALVEVDIQDAAAGGLMSKAFGVDIKYWGQANKNIKNYG